MPKKGHRHEQFGDFRAKKILSRLAKKPLAKPLAAVATPCSCILGWIVLVSRKSLLSIPAKAEIANPLRRKRRHHRARHHGKTSWFDALLHRGGTFQRQTKRVAEHVTRTATSCERDRAGSTIRAKKHRGPLPRRPDQHRRHPKATPIRRRRDGRGPGDAMVRRRDACWWTRRKGRLSRSRNRFVLRKKALRAPADAVGRIKQDRPPRRADSRKCGTRLRMFFIDLDANEDQDDFPRALHQRRA